METIGFLKLAKTRTPQESEAMVKQVIMIALGANWTWQEPNLRNFPDF